jgi:hypothetical protein
MTNKKEVSVPVGFDRAAEFWSHWQTAGFGAIAGSGPAYMVRLGEMNAEVVRFATESVGHNLRVGSEMMHCTDPVEFREVQGRYLKSAFESCCAEVGKLVRLNQDAIDEALGRRSGD